MPYFLCSSPTCLPSSSSGANCARGASSKISTSAVGLAKSYRCVTTKPPMQSSRVCSVAAASSALRNESQGSGIFLELAMCQICRLHVRQQIPVFRFLRPVRAQPISFCLRHAVMTKRVFLHKAGSIEHTRIFFQLPLPRRICGIRSKLYSHRGDKPESVLQVCQFRPLHQPVPVHIRIPRRKPRQPFYDARIKIGFL